MKSLFKKKAKKERQRTTRKGWDDYREDAYYEDSDEYYGDYEGSDEYEDAEEAGYDGEEDSDEYYGDEEIDEEE